MKRCSVSPYEGQEKYIFISYCLRDKKNVFPIMEQLVRDGCRIWFDEGIDPGTEWQEILVSRLKGCSMCIAFLSENFLNSCHCRREMNFAIVKKKTLITVMLEPVTLTPGMELQLSAVRAIHKYSYQYSLEREQGFYARLYETEALGDCRGPADESVSVSEPEEYEENLKDLYGIDEIRREPIGDKWFIEAQCDQDREEDGQAAVLIRVRTNEEIVISAPEMVFGRILPEVGYSVDGNSEVSRIHARIFCRDREFYLADCGSLNNTFVNALELYPGREYRLQEGDIIRFANEKFRFHRMEG